MEIYGAYRANVALIRDAIAENKTQMAQVNQSLVAFQTGLLGVEREMLPIYKLTEKLRETQKNIDLCVQELHRVNDNFVAAQKLAPTLMNGTKYDQDEYIDALEKLLSAIKFLELHRSYEGSTRALEQARELLIQARKKCKADFLSTVAVISRPTRRDDQALYWAKPSKDGLAKTSQLLQCLLCSDVDIADLMGDYGAQRFQIVRGFLCDERNGSLMFSLNDSIEILQRCLSDIEATLTGEKLLAEALFPSEELFHAAFCHAGSPILSALKHSLDVSFQVDEKQVEIDRFKFLQWYELLSARLGDIDAISRPPLLLRDRTGTSSHDPWILSMLLQRTVSETALKTKEIIFGYQFEMTEKISFTDRALVKDGNVHPVSSRMLNFIRRLIEHVKPLKLLLSRESNVAPTTFLETVVMQLVEALQSKSSQSKGRSDLKLIFLVNNLGYISHSLPRCADKDIDHHLQSVVQPSVESLRDKAIKAFIQTSYQPFCSFLIDPKEKLVYAKGGHLLTLESGRLLKEKFAKFNTLIEDIHDTQQHFIVSEPHIRNQLIQSAVDSIVPRYTSFYEKYSPVPFSKKNSSKYLKYTPKAVEQLLKELFLGEVVPNEK